MHIFAISNSITMKHKTVEPIECKADMLLRNVPCEVLEAITRKKMEIMSNNRHRTTVSNSEAIYKLILKG